MGPVALVGSGEYTPALQPVEAALLAGRPPVYVQLATAAAPEGPGSLKYWHDLGREAAERLGVRQVIVPVQDRAGADDPGMAALVAGAGLVYLSGGSPVHLATSLVGSLVWRAIEAAWRDGAALAGCSAGAMALAGQVLDPFDATRPPVPGLAVVPQVRILPHFDRFASRLPTDSLRRLAAVDPGVTLVGIDEDTALVGGIEDWEVRGRGSVWVFEGEARTGYPDGSSVHLPFP